MERKLGVQLLAPGGGLATKTRSSRGATPQANVSPFLRHQDFHGPLRGAWQGISVAPALDETNFPPPRSPSDTSAPVTATAATPGASDGTTAVASPLATSQNATVTGLGRAPKSSRDTPSKSRHSKSGSSASEPFLKSGNATAVRKSVARPAARSPPLQVMGEEAEDTTKAPTASVMPVLSRSKSKAPLSSAASKQAKWQPRAETRGSEELAFYGAAPHVNRARVDLRVPVRTGIA